MRYVGLLYRALNPVWAREPYSGEGARRFGGRFNPKRVPTLYTSLSVITALRESQQIGTLQPTTLVSYDADIAPIFDAGEVQALARYDMTPEGLAADDWRLRMTTAGKAPTQGFAEQLIAEGYAGLKVRSFARGAGVEELNLVLWTWGEALPAKLIVNDEEGRLSR